VKIYLDGSLVPKEEARISVFDHGLLYGDGVFEGLRVYGGRVFRLDEHVRRLYESARAILLDIPLTPEDMGEAVLRTVAANEITEGYVRLIVTRGEGSLGIDPASCPRPTVIIIAGEIEVYPRELYEKGISIVTAPTRRIPAECLEPRVKSLNYLNNVLARMEARLAGCPEAVMLNAQGYVAECTVDNVFVAKAGELMTPPPHHGALDGVTMRAVLELARTLDMPAGLHPLTRHDLYTADECFLTGTGAEIMPVVRVDGRQVSNGMPGNLTTRLRKAFAKLVREEHS
jgi:branched-chain amino acid aminotransferase